MSGIREYANIIIRNMNVHCL